MPIKAEVVISYDMEDVVFVKKLAVKLKEHKVNFWHPPPGENSPQQNLIRGQALLNCKVFIMIMSPTSLKNSALCDELSLAYISNKSILPIGLAYFRPLAANMNGGLKLMLAKIQYTFFVKEKEFTKNLEGFLAAITRESLAYDSRHNVNTEEDTESDTIKRGPLNAQYRDSVYRKSIEPDNGCVRKENPEADDINEKDEDESNEPSGAANVMTIWESKDFWDRHFEGRREVSWNDFRSNFISDYAARIEEDLGEDQQKLLVNIIYRDLFELMKSLKLTTYSSFTYGGMNKPGGGEENLVDSFYDRLKEYAIGSFAMHEVFNMDSSVRLTAVQNLGSFQTPAVISALFDLVQDSDPNIRAVAALALAKTGKRTRKIEHCLLKMLNDDDRLVRESTCLSLACMRCQNAVPHIIDAWRNDPIKHVREAAEIALTRMGGEDAEQAIHITKVLTEEMNNLRTIKN